MSTCSMQWVSRLGTRTVIGFVFGAKNPTLVYLAMHVLPSVHYGRLASCSNRFCSNGRSKNIVVYCFCGGTSASCSVRFAVHFLESHSWRQYRLEILHLSTPSFALKLDVKGYTVAHDIRDSVHWVWLASCGPAVGGLPPHPSAQPKHQEADVCRLQVVP